MERFWFVTSFITLGFAAFVTTALVVVYTFLTQWERTQVGRQFWLTKLCLAAILDWWAISVFFIRIPTEYSPTMPTRSIITLIVGIVMLRWLIILVKNQRSQRRQA
jgi:hypothetical protein